MAHFTDLSISNRYDIIEPASGCWIARSVYGAEAMATHFAAGLEAWPAGEEKFCGRPADIAGKRDGTLGWDRGGWGV